jgi:rhamnulokinase
MKSSVNFLAVDLGAASGRILLGQWDGEHIGLNELHRFPNGPVTIQGHQHWDVLRLWTEIKTGIARYTQQNSGPLLGIGVDTWGVDFALLDSRGNLVGNPYHYRDSRTDGIMESAYQKMPREHIFKQTGNQLIQFNTLYQLFSMAQKNDPQLEIAETLLMMPDLFHYWLTGRKTTEFTIATTTQMYDIRRRCWATQVLAELEIPTGLAPSVVAPGTILGQLSQNLMDVTDLHQPANVITPAGHDTSNAIAAIPGLDHQSVYISSGTWSLMGVEISEPIVNDQALALNFTNEGGVDNKINLLKILTGLWLLQESRHQWRREGGDYTWQELLALSEQAEPFQSLVDPDAPDFLNPTDMLKAIGSFCCRTGQPQPDSVGAVVRCCLESLALNYRKTLEDLETLIGRHLDTIRIVGGGSQNGLLSQFTADACQRLVISGPVEATALGNILLQVVATGHLQDIAAGRQVIGASFEQQEFEPGSAEAWQEAYARFKKLKNYKKH